MDTRLLPGLALNKSLAFTSIPTYQEYLHQLSSFANRLRQRANEVRLSAEEQSFFSTYPDFLHLVALVSEETPDSWIVPPIWERIAASSPRFTIRLLTEEDELSPLACLLDESDLETFLSEIELPQLFIFDEEWNLQGQWGPHPQSFDSFLDTWLADYPEYERLTESDDPTDIANYTILAEQLTGEMRMWYNEVLNQECASEIRLLLSGLSQDVLETEPSPDDSVEEESIDSPYP